MGKRCFLTASPGPSQEVIATGAGAKPGGMGKGPPCRLGPRMDRAGVWPCVMSMVKNVAMAYPPQKVIGKCSIQRLFVKDYNLLDVFLWVD
jgi:hypothetical protein